MIVYIKAWMPPLVIVVFHCYYQTTAPTPTPDCLLILLLSKLFAVVEPHDRLLTRFLSINLQVSPLTHMRSTRYRGRKEKMSH